MQPDSSESSFYLHIPFEAAPGHSFEIVGRGPMRLNVLGYPAFLSETVFSGTDPRMSTASSNVMQWLLFDPLAEATARQLFSDLYGRMYAFSFRTKMPVCIRSNTLSIAQHGIYSGTFPTLVPTEFDPAPTWGLMGFTSRFNGKCALEDALAECQSIRDHRLIAALDMYVFSLHETSGEAAFLKLTTILDYLAVESDRPADICKWLDETYERARSLSDSGLSSSISMLKKTSRRAAIKDLVSRSGKAKGLPEDEIAGLAKSAGEIYTIRSKLSHEGSVKDGDLKLDVARSLVDLVLEAAINDSKVLLPSEPAPKSTNL